MRQKPRSANDLEPPFRPAGAPPDPVSALDRHSGARHRIRGVLYQDCHRPTSSGPLPPSRSRHCADAVTPRPGQVMRRHRRQPLTRRSWMCDDGRQPPPPDHFRHATTPAITGSPVPACRQVPSTHQQR
ncbi:hypothetical protein BV133_272 [Blastochloris viridis]|uniref:Uncharacterized protein n=1 Tax=Blastochloris viridis TaxID=1079 RepID=A0A182CXF1_BLAVI|nr:hypothetical protein BV133_272 [Blastochloris viridis]